MFKEIKRVKLSDLGISDTKSLYKVEIDQAGDSLSILKDVREENVTAMITPVLKLRQAGNGMYLTLMHGQVKVAIIDIFGKGITMTAFGYRIEKAKDATISFNVYKGN